MAISYNPGIVTGDLGLCLDVFNPESFTGSSTVWYDVSGNNLHATGSSGLSATGLATGGSSYSTPSTSLLNTDTHSIFFTIRFNTNGTYPNGTSGNWDMIFQYAAGGTDRTPGVWRYPSDRLIHWRYEPGNTGNDFGQTSLVGGGGSAFATNTWFYIGQTKNGTTATAYVNGVSLGTGTVASPKTRGSAAITLFPYYAAPAQLGCVHVYNNVLTAAQVEQNFNAIRRNYGI